MCVVHPNTLIEYNELPKINGVLISAIYAQKHDIDGFYTNRDLYVGETPDFYLCVPVFSRSGYIRIKELPNEFKEIFGNQIGYNRKVQINSISYRTSNSYNGSFVDDSICISGTKVTNKTSDSFSICRGVNDYGIGCNSDLGLKMLATLNLNVKVKACDEWDYMFYPCNKLFNIGGLNYPDTPCSSWKNRDMPYVSYDNKENIRVYFEPTNSHLYLQRVEPEIGDEDLICVEFPTGYDKKPEIFCFINHWSRTKENAPNQIIRWRIDKKTKNSVDATAMINGEPEMKREKNTFEWYRLMRLVNI